MEENNEIHKRLVFYPRRLDYHLKVKAAIADKSVKDYITDVLIKHCEND